MYLYFSKLPVRRWFRGILGLASTLVATVGWAGPDPAVLDQAHESVRAVMALQGLVTADLMTTPEILGTAVGLDDDGAPGLVVFVDRDEKGVADVVRALPAQLRGIAVKVHLTDKFRAFPG